MKESEYKDLFLIEARDNIEELNRLFVDLEKDHASLEIVNAIFRITHTLKGNAMGLGLESLAELSHVCEDVMLAIKEKRLVLGQKLFDLLFRANDKLGALVEAIETDEKVSYLGIKTSLAIFLKNELTTEEKAAQQAETSGDEDAPVDDAEEKEEKVEKEDATAAQAETSNQITFSDVIQIPVKKMDDLMNEVGQLIIERDRLIANAQDMGFRSSEFDRLQRITSNLQYSIMNARMVQVGFLFNKFHRVLRDAASIENKKVNLVLRGTETEIDRNILKILSDSLVHLVRNSVSHGIETEEERKKTNKPMVGTVQLGAHYERDRVVITVTDDGKGIDHEVIRRKIVEKGMVSQSVAKNLKPEEVVRYIFEAGFSNADKVNELSGRGVGMDVVKRAVESIGGQVRVNTTVGEGTTTSLHVPSSLALKGTLLFKVEEHDYAIALSYAESVVTFKKSELYKLGGGLMTKYQGEPVSIIFFRDVLSLQKLSDIYVRGSLHKTFDTLEGDPGLSVIMVSYAGRMMGVVVDTVLQQKEIIEKPLAKPLDKNKLLSGTTILGNGKVCLVVDPAVMTDLIFKQAHQTQAER